MNIIPLLYDHRDVTVSQIVKLVLKTKLGWT
jgi:hypothetical protein